MSSIWQSNDGEEWRSLYETYDGICEGLEDHLKELEKWYKNELPQIVKTQRHITKPQLSKLMQWKLSKGKWRPRLQAFIDVLPPKDVKELSEDAIDACDHEHYREAIGMLSILKGVGPATASAVLAAYDENVPFMGDEALNALEKDIGKRQYSLSHFLRYHQAILEKVSTLNKSSTDSFQWTCQKIQLCLWIEHMRDAPPKPSKKRASKSTVESKKRARK